MKTNLMHYLSAVYFISQPLHVSGHVCSPSSGVILYMYNNWYVLCFSAADLPCVIINTVVLTYNFLVLQCFSADSLLACPTNRQSTEQDNTYQLLYMLSSKIKNAHWAEKTTTTRCGIRETATTRNCVLWLFLNNHNAFWHERNSHNAKCLWNELFISLVIYC